MTSELSFLLDLILNHKLPKATKDLVAARIKEVEGRYNIAAPSPQMARPLPAHIANQAPSMQAIMLKHGELATVNGGSLPVVPPEPAPVPVEQVAQTPAAVAAMASRNAAIAASLDKRINKETGRPRKF